MTKPGHKSRDTDCVVLAARRTPMGAFQGSLTKFRAPDLGAIAIREVIPDSVIDAREIYETYMGCVLTAGLGQAPARSAALKGGVPSSVPAITINKVCGSGMKSIMLAHDSIKSGAASFVLAGGMESMSNAPYLLPDARSGYRMGDKSVVDHMIFDGLSCALSGNSMGSLAEDTAAHYGFSRDAQDAFARESLLRARRAIGDGSLKAEIIEVANVDGSIVTEDENPLRSDLDKIPGLNPAFRKNGTITAASASGIADGAAAVLLATQSAAKRHNQEPIGRILGHASHAQAPEWFTTAPIGAIRKLLARLSWQPDDVDLFEINEAFACVTMAAIDDLNLDPEKVNVNGGACAFGHPIGATGCRIVVSLIHALRQRGLKRGIAAICIGGGEATAIAVEGL